MQNNKKANLYTAKELFWLFSLIMVFTVINNIDWRASRLIWYGSVVLLLIAYLVAFNARFVLTNISYIMWLAGFILLGALSLMWSDAFLEITDLLKTLLAIFVITSTIQFSINGGFKITNLLKCYFIATIINAIYIVLTIDVARLGDVQLGTGLIEGWNGNSIGNMTAQGAIIGWYLLEKEENKISKIVMLCCVIPFIFLTMLTGSRTAFIILVSEFAIYFCLRHPTKMVRNIIIAVVALVFAVYLVMKVEWLYNVLGSRLEGLFAFLSGEGKVDSSTDLRNVYIQNGKEWFLNKPILGYGLNAYRAINYVTTGRYTYAHNNFIEIGVNLGLVGLILYYGAYLYLIIRLAMTFKGNRLNVLLLSALIGSLISHYGSVSYYGLYQNFLLLLCFSAWHHSETGGNKT